MKYLIVTNSLLDMGDTTRYGVRLSLSLDLPLKKKEKGIEFIEN